MFRQAPGAARAAWTRPATAVRVRTGRWYSSSSAAAAAAPRPRSPLKPTWAIGLLAAGGAGSCYYYYLGRRGRGVDSGVPGIPDAASEAEIPVESPVEALDLEAANQKLRENARSFVFSSGDGRKGRVDVVRVSSNSPVEDEWALGFGKGLGGGDALYAGVYDGHAGWATSAVLKTALIRYVSHALGQLPPSSPGDAVDTAIKDAFSRLDARIMDTARRHAEAGLDHGAGEVIRALAPAIAGSCALLSIYEPASSTLRTAVTGDSRAVLGCWSPATGSFSAEALSRDQTGFNEDEVRRLANEHPGEAKDMIDPKTGRLLGIAITRGFGDHRWKWADELVRSVQSSFFGYAPRPGCKTPPYMTARPELTTRRVSTADFAILASDGLWDVMSNDDAVACVQRWLAAKRAGAPERVTDAPSAFTLGADGYVCWKATPETFAIEDLDSAAVCLVKNALGGRRRTMLCGALTAYAPMSRYVRDDMTVQVVFFRDPYGDGGTGETK